MKSDTFCHPLYFVLEQFPWGKKGTILENEIGPEVWQREVLQSIADDMENLSGAVRIAASGGHGVGHGALLAWILLWFVSTREYARIAVTAGTQYLLEQKTWPELLKWRRLLERGAFFEMSDTRISLKEAGLYDGPQAIKIPRSEEEPELFAGMMEENCLAVFDEPAVIPDKIWDVVESWMTSKGSMWVVAGKITRETGRFCGCFTDSKHLWRTFQVDNRTTRRVNKEVISRWVDEYGEDSNLVRVRVRGLAPLRDSKT